jgi:serine/threonine protein kinase
MAQQVVRTVGRYEILREIGRGGMAAVYLARQVDLDRHVALKELGAFHAADPAFAERFLRESRVAGSLSHPNIVTVHEYFEHEGTPFIAMEYLTRGSLRPVMSELTLAQVAGVMEGLLAGLTHAASHGIVHRDLKPENLMITGEGRIKIADFGIAKAYNQAATGRFLTATGTTVGTPAYMAPEQAMAKDIGPWTDLYSVGVMAYELLIGNVPFHDTTTPMAILLRHVNDPVPRPRKAKPDLDVHLADWIESLLEKSPSDRPASAEAAWETLEEAVIQILGPRWRRDARLNAPTTVVSTPEPLTPAPFHEPSAEHEQAAEPDFATFHRGSRASASETPMPAPIPDPLPVGPIAEAEPVQETAAPLEPDAEPLIPSPDYLTYQPEQVVPPPQVEVPPAPEPIITPLEPDAEPLIPSPDYLTYQPEQVAPPPPVAVPPAPVTEPPSEETPVESLGAMTAAPARVAEPEPAEPAPPFAEPAPPERLEPKTPSGATSFQWPTVAGRSVLRSRRGGLIAGAAVVIAAVVGGIIVLAGGGNGGSHKTVTPLVTTKPALAEQLGLATADDRLYISDPAGRLISLTPKTTISDPAHPRAVAAGKSTLFVADDSTVTGFGPRLEPLKPVALPDVQALAPAGSRVAAVAKASGGGRLCLVGTAGAGPCSRLPFTPTGVGVAGAAIYVASGAGAVVPYRLRKNRLSAGAPIRVGRSPHALVAFRGRLYVAVANGVAVVDLASHKLVRTIGFGASPSAVTIASSSGRLFVALYGTDKIAMVDTVANAAPKITASVKRPVALSSTGSAVFAVSALGHSVATLDPLTGALKRLTPVAALRLGAVAPTTLDKVRFSASGRRVIVKFTFRGTGFDPRGFTVDDTQISKGHASFALWQGGISSRVGSTHGRDVSVGVTRADGLLNVRMRAKPGTFISFKPTVGQKGTSIGITLTRKPVAKKHVTTSVTHSTVQVTTQNQVTTPTHVTTQSSPGCVNHRKTIYRRGRPVVVPC